MHERQQNILQKLYYTKSYLTSSEIALSLQVSSKTIRNDIKAINQHLENYSSYIKSFKGKGYFLIINSENSFNKIIKEWNASLQKSLEVPSTKQEREHYLLKILLTSLHYIKIEDLIEQLYVSRSTLKNELKHVREVLDKYNIILKQRPYHGIKIVGNEEQIRFCISEHLFNQPSTLKENMNNWLNVLPKNTIEVIKDSVLFHLRKYKIWISDIGLQNLITHISIACKRIREDNSIQHSTHNIQKMIEKKEFSVAKEIAKDIQKKTHVKFSDYEIAYLAIHLQGTKLEPSYSPKKEMVSFINQNLYELVKKMLRRIESEYSICLIQDTELLQAMSLHLKPAINRHKFNMNIRNPMLEEIKMQYTFSFNAALVGAQVLFEEIGISIDEHEIGYLALHIELAQERKKKEDQNAHRCLILCASGLGSAQLLMHKLQNEFGELLNIIGTIEFYNLKHQSFSDIDFIISTIPIEKNIPVPVIQVSTILGETDLNKVKTMINEKVTDIHQFLRKEHTDLQKEIMTKEKVIDFICQKLEKSNLVDETYKYSVLERESYSSTNFGNMVALPHPINTQTDATFLSIMTLTKPIIWGEGYVQLIIMLNISKNENQDLKGMYNALLKLLDQQNIVNKLLECESYEEFEKTIQVISEK